MPGCRPVVEIIGNLRHRPKGRASVGALLKLESIGLGGMDRMLSDKEEKI